MGHAALMRWEIKLTQARAVSVAVTTPRWIPSRGRIMGKEQPLRVQPNQSRGVLQQKMRLASQS